ncbi:hypothetical protein RJ639_017017 [Escallonia herrerae]|uniref:Fe-S metabolism associated domain-containing protein n=1 Tax=Escallonia herrerae TaxID=1293975 RepID=A0AA89AL74_9ASTE|nr:hypothetical protein RJ639_017017 [Escallonia herrerae]
MHSAALKSLSRTPPPLTKSSKPTNLKVICPNPTNQNHKKPIFLSHKCVQTSGSILTDKNPDSSEPWLALTVTESPVRPANVAEKLEFLVREFLSLPEPIDRVKRLLQYAGLLPEFEESGRVEANRVMGCTAQVWLEVRMEVGRVMRFRVDSDSEITKGFCSCLIWMLDGAAPEEVLAVRREDLVEMNVGLPANSRVNTWHNVLISMQRRTRDLLEERDW